jgi:hypothetical protein
MGGTKVDVARVVALLAELLDGRGVRWALCGGLGLAAYGLARTTFDVDVVADGDNDEAVVAAMEANGFATLFRSRGYSNHLHPDPGLGRVDFVYVRGATAGALFAQARQVAGPAGRTVLVPRPEHLAAMKVAAMRADPARLFQDLADVRFLLTLPGVDREEVRSHFARHGMEARFDELVATL